MCSDNEIPTEYFAKLNATSHRKLINEWYAITSDSFSVAMRKVDVSKDHFDRQGIAEVFKYAVKFSTLDTPRLVELIALQKRRQYRFYATTGIFRGWQRQQEKQTKIISSTEAQQVEQLLYEDFHFDNTSHIYRKQKKSLLRARAIDMVV